MPERYVKLGRKPLSVHIGHHWAVQVEDSNLKGMWYEIAGAAKGDKNSANRINHSYGEEAGSGAGALGGEIVGKTRKTDHEIQRYNDQWVRNNPTYGITDANCQKFAIQFIAWLTSNNFKLPHGLDAGFIPDIDNYPKIAVNHGGQAFAAIGSQEKRGQAGTGLLPASMRGPYAEAEAIAGPGVGAWANASAGRYEQNYGNVAEIHADLNVNTGAGIRGGNVDVHLLGFGGRVGTDGLEVNTPLGGARLPWVAAPINFVGSLFRN